MSTVAELQEPPSAVSSTAVVEPHVKESILPTYVRRNEALVRGEGVFLYDESDKRYLDFTSGIAVNSLGYNDAGVAEVMRSGIESGLLHTSNLYRTLPGERLADWLVAHSFASRVFFCNSGAEANEAAFKFARRWSVGSGKTGIVSLRGAFHGRLPGTLAATDKPAYQQPFLPLMGDVQIVERDIDALKAVVDAEKTAAVIVEPVQGESGVRVLGSAFLQELRQLTHERNVLLIFDEIQCGLGRTGYTFAYERTGAVPDIVTIAKPLANGLPIGAVLVNEAVAASIHPGDHGTTFGGGPFVASVAEHVVKRLSDPKMLRHVRETGEWFGQELKKLAERSGSIREVRGLGMMWGIDTHELSASVISRAFDKGLLLVGAGPHTIRVLPPLVMTREELSMGIELLESVLAEE